VGFPAEEFGIEQRGFDFPETADAPAGDGHLLYQVLFGAVRGVVVDDEFVQHFVEFFLRFAGQDDGAPRCQAVLDGIL
jgi:hypothetical protein